MERAFVDLYGSAEGCRGFSFAGMTDRAIVRVALRAIGSEDHPTAIDSVVERYLVCLRDELPIATDYRVLPGVVALLDSARVRRDLALGLGTGNVQTGATLKLAHGKLDTYFAFGGFGSDHEDRAELIRVGAERGARQLGHPVRDCRVVVIGDTPKDVAAAQANDAESIGVATGRHDLGSLRAAGATQVFTSLADAGAHAAVFG
jgi:phosphoglycolate phosphatase